MHVILGYKTVINDDKVDTDLVKAVIEVKIQPEREGGFDRIAKRIAKFNEVTSLFLMSGGYDLLIFVEGRNLREVAQFVACTARRPVAVHQAVEPLEAILPPAIPPVPEILKSVFGGLPLRD